ncbi:putative colanic acid biosynthesis acetyltransferase [Thermomonas sp.]|uniref:putative colanic acid biosynthesis acetyltransferase n=1 Tax=Thermomonas sp. TaxID=1971895 RepID=UPI002C06115E|nr:putative colanic acid biosynthesis acetyltransferase [Thermomonas sp.]HRO63212.1 putative colanic acid biosynthesis acetyltransferase [Thermomonas sp.]
MTLDIATARSARPYSRREYVGRVLWALATPLFRCSPRPLFGWRNLLLRLFGAKLGRGVHVDPGARIEIPWNLELGDHAAIGAGVWVYNLGPIRVGARATVSHRAHLCGGSHDYTDPALPLLRTGLAIGDDAWVCADAFVGPGVTVGEGAVVGAAAVAMRDVEPWAVVAGNPARVVKRRALRQAQSP